MTPGRFAKLKQVLDRRQPDLTILTEDVHKPHNISAILRSCDAVGILTAHAVSADGSIPRYHMTSGGSRKWVGIRVHSTLSGAVNDLRKAGFRLAAAHQSSTALDYRDVDYREPVALLLGSELIGVSAKAAELADVHVVIPMQGMVSSLNVSVAAALILFEARRQREQSGLYDRCRLDNETYAKTLFEWAYPEVAESYRKQKRPYPALDGEGYIKRTDLFSK